ncbi:MAG: sensor histidine kinase [Oscillospiraceae bacterium]
MVGHGAAHARDRCCLSAAGAAADDGGQRRCACCCIRQGALALAFLLFYGKPGRKLLAVAAELTASVLVEMLFSAATMRAADFQMDAHYSVWADPHAALYGGVFLLFLALVLLVVSLPFLRARNNLSGRQLLVFSVFPVTQILCSAAIQALIFYPPRYEYTSVLLVVTALFLVSDSLLFRTMVRTEQRVQLEVENELLESQLDAQLAHYGDLTAQYEQIRTMRHDISHHLNTINALLQAGNLQAASEYSEQLLPAQAYSSRLGGCRNPVVDAFLYTRTQEAGLRGVPVRADVSLPVELPVSNTDLIVAFGNLLDNALEACSGIPDAAIDAARAHWIRAISSFRSRTPSVPGSRRDKSPGASRSWSAGWAFVCWAASPRSTTAASGTRAKTIPTPSRSRCAPDKEGTTL